MDYADGTFQISRDSNLKPMSITLKMTVLEAKLVLRDDIVVSICSELLKNDNQFEILKLRLTVGAKDPSQKEEKQDCEIKGFYKMEQKLKARYQSMKMAVMEDSLYACAPVFEICKKTIGSS
jgi:hypothetical protein